jgi:SAM-dependent methyltransferase
MSLSALRRMRFLVPRSLRTRAKVILGFWLPGAFKYKKELDFWDTCYKEEGAQFENEYYRKRMLGMAGEPDDSFLSGRIVADFGCGPRGSLWWATSARLRIGIDVLTEEYSKFNIRAHDMVYVSCSEWKIPLPSNYVDVLFTLNAMDHVSHFAVMCRELLRILSPGGLLIGSFNLDEAPTLSEPQRLTEKTIQKHLLKHLHVESYRIAAPGEPDSLYLHFFDGSASPTAGPRFLWIRARKP